MKRELGSSMGAGNLVKIILFRLSVASTKCYDGKFTCSKVVRP